MEEGDKDSYEGPGRGQTASYIYCFAEATGTGRWVVGLAPSKMERGGRERSSLVTGKRPSVGCRDGWIARAVGERQGEGETQAR